MCQRSSLSLLILVFSFLASCGGKKKTTADVQPKDTNAINQTAGQLNNSADTSLSSLKPLLEKELGKWMQSFKDFNIDSFHQLNVQVFREDDYETVDDLRQFYELYKPSLSFSPDSSQFIDLYSNGVSLEKKGKKIIAIGDADQGVTLCNLKTKSWKNILSFGPSASIEEALWISPAEFILAGSMQNDEGKQQPVLLVGNTDKRSFRWFEAACIRNVAAKYEASGFSKLKIDEWE